MSRKKKAVVYARVSTDKEEQAISLESQREYYTQYAKDKGYEFLKVYYDEGLSAASSNRTAYIQMLKDAGLKAERDGNIVTFKVDEYKEPLFDWIIVKDASRFARNVNAIDIVRALEVKNVYVEFESFGFTSQDHDWQFRLSLFFTFAQEESLSTSKKLKDAFYKRSKSGKFHMSVNLLGYGRDKEKDEHYIIEEEAEIVRKIFDYYTKDKKGSYEIGDLLNEQGYKTKKGKVWNSNNVIRVINNEKYKGQVILNRFSNTSITYSNKRVINPKDEWIVYDNALPKIVSVEQFDEAQRIRENRTKQTSQLKGKPVRQVRGKKIIKNVFHNKIFCRKCGADYVRLTSPKIKKGEKINEHFYTCRNRRNKQRNVPKCMSRGIAHHILVEELEKISNKMNIIDFDEETLVKEEIALEEKLNQVDELIENSEQEKEKIDEKIKEIDNQIQNLFNTLSHGTSDTIVKMTHEQIESLEIEKKELEASKTNYDIIQLENKKIMYENKFNNILSLSKKDSYTFDELLEQIYEIEIIDDSKVVVKFFVPTLQMEDDETKRLSYYMFTR